MWTTHCSYQRIGGRGGRGEVDREEKEEEEEEDDSGLPRSKFC